MKKTVLVTLADANFIDQAKQLFSSIYWNAGWKGDYLLLANEIPAEKLKWFREKGILIKECKKIIDKDYLEHWPVTILSKFYLFTEYFKKWDNVVYLDADMIVRYNLDKLTQIQGFSGFIEGKIKTKLKDTKLNTELYEELKKKYNVNEKAIAGGIMAFSTNIISENTFKDLQTLFLKYQNISQHDEAILSMYFYKKIQGIPDMYNVCVNYAMSKKTKTENVKGIILHFVTAHDYDKPWDLKNKYYPEWKNNLDKSYQMDLKNRPEGKTLSDTEFKKHLRILKLQRFYHRDIISKIDQKIGLIGIFLKKHTPKLYQLLKRN